MRKFGFNVTNRKTVSSKEKVAGGSNWEAFSITALPRKVGSCQLTPPGQECYIRVPVSTYLAPGKAWKTARRRRRSPPGDGEQSPGSHLAGADRRGGREPLPRPGKMRNSARCPPDGTHARLRPWTRTSGALEDARASVCPPVREEGQSQGHACRFAVRLDGLTHVECFAHCLAHRKRSINGSCSP